MEFLIICDQSLFFPLVKQFGVDFIHFIFLIIRWSFKTDHKYFYEIYIQTKSNIILFVYNINNQIIKYVKSLFLLINILITSSIKITRFTFAYLFCMSINKNFCNMLICPSKSSTVKRKFLRIIF